MDGHRRLLAEKRKNLHDREKEYKDSDCFEPPQPPTPYPVRISEKTLVETAKQAAAALAAAAAAVALIAAKKTIAIPLFFYNAVTTPIDQQSVRPQA